MSTIYEWRTKGQAPPHAITAPAEHADEHPDPRYAHSPRPQVGRTRDASRGRLHCDRRRTRAVGRWRCGGMDQPARAAVPVERTQSSRSTGR
ncbi:hypothetical protein [Microbacterium sp. zg.B185]|uniref:hypothetical protein n=1 Tax=Microbacterium sp. zg.B185 TaxID=2969410 RepID=UPI0035B64FD0